MTALFKAAAVAVDRVMVEFERAVGMVIIAHISLPHFLVFQSMAKGKK